MFQEAPFANIDSLGDPLPPISQVAVVNVNLIGPMYTSTLAAFYWQREAKTVPKDNVLIIVSSNIAYHAMGALPGYTASKFGARGMWKSFRETEQFHGLFRTNLLAPHIVRTPMTVGIQPLVEAEGLDMAEIPDCVDALLRLCGPGVAGRAVQVNPKGVCFDLCDDLEVCDSFFPGCILRLILVGT